MSGQHLTREIIEPLPQPPWVVRLAWWLWAQWRYPFDVRELKRLGFTRRGFRRWGYNWQEDDTWPG
ncbi:MAG TPA: hypothetical protein VEV45_21075 [Streptosporangiaceae bacterium]|nr:hypothetical protein [Streptosporangiaceae bacterium]